ncbi:hypothetical protein CYMTET_10882, partial [Cymbomonas tetramitiformis]
MEETGKLNAFLVKTPEREDLNQYWYSQHTIDTIRKELEKSFKRIAFLSTPSIFFSLKDKALRKNCVLFDLDEQWTKLPNNVIYDFNKPSEIPSDIHHSFDCVVIDPRFITREVWEKYTE